MSPNLDKLSTSIVNLAESKERLHDLCGEMLACLHVNMLRETMTTADDAQFLQMIDNWRERWMKEGSYETETHRKH